MGSAESEWQRFVPVESCIIMLMKAKVYIETSVISYLTARTSRDIIVTANQQQATQEWWLIGFEAKR